MVTYLTLFPSASRDTVALRHQIGEPPTALPHNDTGAAMQTRPKVTNVCCCVTEQWVSQDQCFFLMIILSFKDL